MWTNVYLLTSWYDTWGEALVELKFGRAKEEVDKEVVGELVFHQGDEKYQARIGGDDIDRNASTRDR